MLTRHPVKARCLGFGWAVPRKDGTKAIVQGDVTDENLAKAFVELAGAKSNGCPFASKHSNCDPTACGFKK